MIKFGITFDGEKHTCRDFGLICTSLQVGLPEIKTKKIELKGADGYIDLTQVFGRTLYGNRIIRAEFALKERNAYDWADNISNISNYLHGRNRKIVMDNDGDYYYEGRISVECEKTYHECSIVKLEADCKPYKKEMQNSTEGDWLWSPFSFVDGVIRNYKNLTVNGTHVIDILGLDQPVVPIITSSADMTVLYKGIPYVIMPGKNVLYQLVTEKGINTYTFQGQGTITIEYRGGMI